MKRAKFLEEKPFLQIPVIKIDSTEIALRRK
jgi:hypothetical protein